MFLDKFKQLHLVSTHTMTQTSSCQGLHGNAESRNVCTKLIKKENIISFIELSPQQDLIQLLPQLLFFCLCQFHILKNVLVVQNFITAYVTKTMLVPAQSNIQTPKSTIMNPHISTLVLTEFPQFFCPVAFAGMLALRIF